MADKNKNPEESKDDDRPNSTPKLRETLANQPAETGLNGYRYPHNREPVTDEREGLGE